MWSHRWKHLNSCHSHCQTTWGEMSQGGCHSTRSVSLLLEVSEYGGFIWGWWCWGSCGGQEGSSGTCCTWSTVRRSQGLFPSQGLDQNSSEAGWCPTALLQHWKLCHMGTGVTALQNPGARVERTDSHCGEWIPTVGLPFALDKERLCLSNLP